MKPIRIPTLSPEQLDALETLYRTTREARLRTRAQMVLLAAEQRLTAAEIAEIVRASEETVRRWLKRYLAEGVEGLHDVPHPGAPCKVTEEYRELLVQVVRRHPRGLQVHPHGLVLDPDAKELFKGAVNELGAERHRPGFPARLKGPYSKLEAYLARLSLILAVARAANTGVAERVEEDDVLAAVVLVDYFKGMARHVYRENPQERFVEDVAKFLEGRSGYFKDEPHVLHEQLESRYKPPRPDELTKKLKDIIPRTPGLTLNTGNFTKDAQSRRCVEISLENGVNGVNGVNPATGDKLNAPWEKHFGLDDEASAR